MLKTGDNALEIGDKVVVLESGWQGWKEKIYQGQQPQYGEVSGIKSDSNGWAIYDIALENGTTQSIHALRNGESMFFTKDELLNGIKEEIKETQKQIKIVNGIIKESEKGLKNGPFSQDTKHLIMKDIDSFKEKTQNYAEKIQKMENLASEIKSTPKLENKIKAWTPSLKKDRMEKQRDSVGIEK